MSDTELIDGLEALCISIEPVGSRVTCNPAPDNTDRDYLVLVDAPHEAEFMKELDQRGFSMGGSEIPDEHNTVPPADRFYAFREGEFNLVVTRSASLYRRFMAATYVAKRLNLLVKADRIALFQAVLYANVWTERVAVEEEEIAF